MQAAASCRYPWEALEVLSREAVRQAALARRRIERAVRLDTLAAAIGDALSAEARITVHRVEVLDSTQLLPSARVELALADGSADFTVGLEPELATAALSRVLQRPVHLEPADAPLGSVLSGALSALVVEVARRAGNGQALMVRRAPTRYAAENGVALEATLLLDGRPYRVGAWLRAAAQPTAEPDPVVTLEQLGPVEVALPLVAGICATTRAELQELEPGDAFSCGPGWLLDESGQGRCALAAPSSELGVAVDLAKDGDLVLRGETVDLALDLNVDEAMTDSNEALTDTLLDAPIVVRVELGAVSMLARDWAKLAPGDVILAGRRIAEPAVLRVAGREVARGELVNVDGELGVRIQQIEQGEVNE